MVIVSRVILALTNTIFRVVSWLSGFCVADLVLPYLSPFNVFHFQPKISAATNVKCELKSDDGHGQRPCWGCKSLGWGVRIRENKKANARHHPPVVCESRQRPCRSEVLFPVEIGRIQRTSGSLLSTHSSCNRVTRLFKLESMPDVRDGRNIGWKENEKRNIQRIRKTERIRKTTLECRSICCVVPWGGSDLIAPVDLFVCRIRWWCSALSCLLPTSRKRIKPPLLLLISLKNMKEKSRDLTGSSAANVPQCNDFLFASCRPPFWMRI